MTEAVRKELERLASLRLVTSRRRDMHAPPVDVVNVGVTFRTDQRGEAHTDHDMAAINRMNQLKDRKGGPLFPFRVVGVGLPRGARGQDTPVRTAKWSDLDDIHLLYIPGSLFANDTQEGSSIDPALRKEEEDFNRAPPVRKHKESEKDFLKRMADYLRQRGEHVSRAPYELRLLGMARNRGIPILAVCGGSWRLLESFGGKVRTLEIVPRNHHKAADRAETWNLENALRLVGGKTLIKLMTAKGYKESRLLEVTRETPEIRLTTPPTKEFPKGRSNILVPSGSGVHGVNSTHWAVPSTSSAPEISLTSPEGETTVLVGKRLLPGADDPSKLLEVSAIDPDTDTVEAFESLYGAPTHGIQWHPESYLPGMIGENSGSEEARALSRALFELMGFAAQTAKRRTQVANALNVEGRAFDLLCECARLTASGRMVGAGNAYRGASEMLKPELWSGRMIAVDESITMLGDSLKESELGRMVAAGNLYRGAQQTLREYGVTI